MSKAKAKVEKAKAKVEKGQFAVGYDTYGELRGGRVINVEGGNVFLGGVAHGTIHAEDATVIDVPENDVPDERLKPHVVLARQRARAAAKAGK